MISKNIVALPVILVENIMSEFASHSLISKAKAFHETVKICDGHNDLPWFINQLAAPIGVNGLDLTVNHHGRKYVGPLHACLHTDIPRLVHGGIGWQFWSVYVPSTIPGPMAVQMTLEQIDVVHRMIEKYPDVFELAYCSEGVERIRNSGKIASMCGVEGGHQINSSLASLRMFYALGARYMTLTHNGAPPWADAAVDFDNIKFLTDAPKGGLTAFGYLVIQEMNRLGMLVDLSHVHQLTMKKAILASRAPVIFSHSSSRALCNVRFPFTISNNITYVTYFKVYDPTYRYKLLLIINIFSTDSFILFSLYHLPI